MIEMFSNQETKVFGAMVLIFVGLILVMYLFVEAMNRHMALKEKERNVKRKIDRRYELDRNEFTEIGEAALRKQRMQSFIAETGVGEVVEVTVDDILKEVKERCGQQEI